MKFKIVLCLLIVVSGFSFSQQFTAGKKGEKINQLKSRNDIKITEIGTEILKLEYPDGKIVYEDFSDYIDNQDNILQYSPTFDSTIIDLRTIDTSLYYYMYSFWQEVKVGSGNTNPPLVGDVNKNGLTEIYGMMKDYNSEITEVVIKEMRLGGSFDTVYSYNNTSNAERAIYDIDKDGWDEIFLHRYPSDTNYPGSSYIYFKKSTDNMLATDFSFVFYPFPEGDQLDQNTFGDWDGDEFTDQVFVRSCCPPAIFIFEYNPTKNNFDSVYQYDFSAITFYSYGFAIGDINQNGKTEFFSGGVKGDVFAIENCGDNCYKFIWQGKVETYNAYLYAVTNDLDGNGKPEVWLGGYHFQGEDAITRITIFEANEDNNYVAVGKVDIIGVFNWDAKNMQVLDVDRDGKEEVMMCIDQHVIILKFNGDVSHQSYEVFHLRRNDLAFSGRNSVFYGATMYDVTGDGKEDIIIHLDEIIKDAGMRLFTYIYKSDITLDVNEPDNLPERYSLSQNYPNPFNPNTIIKYQIPVNGLVSMKIYDILGKEISTLVHEEKSAGRYEVNFNASNLASGVYIYRVKVNEFVESKKMVLMK